MNLQQALIDDLDRTLSSHDIGSRADALRRVADLFLTAPGAYSDREIAVFDDVMLRLVQDIEASLRAALAVRLSRIPNAPKNLMCVLAADQAIEVAGPVLRYSERLDDPVLVATARTSSQEHLLAIARRATVSEPVTDVLIERGERIVALSAVNNAGARFSPAGHALLIERSRDDEDMAAGLWARADIPHHQLLKLLSVASQEVRRRLEAVDDRKMHFIHDMMLATVSEIQGEMRARSRDYIAAQQHVVEIHRSGQLDDAAVQGFARDGAFEATTVALSILCDLPVGACERAMVQDRPELVIVLARAIRLSWQTTRAILLLRAGPRGMAMADREAALNAFSRLKPETAIKALHFLRLRERAAASSSAPGIAAYH